MARIELTQYLMPDGRKTVVHFNGSDELAGMVSQLSEAGLALECEVLQTGEVSVTLSNGEEDVDIIVVPNGPGVMEATGEMIRRTHAAVVEGAS